MSLLHAHLVFVTNYRHKVFTNDMLTFGEYTMRNVCAELDLDLRTRLFAAPGWVVSPGVQRVLPRNGFRLLAGLHGITELVTGHTVRARVLGIGEGFVAEPWWCRMLVRAAERTAARGGVVRLAVAAPQLGKPGPRQAMLDAVDVALAHGCTPTVYRWQPDPVVTDAA